MVLLMDEHKGDWKVGLYQCLCSITQGTGGPEERGQGSVLMTARAL